MDGFSILLIIVAIVVLVLFVAYVINNGYIDQFNSRLDELTGNDEVLSPQLRKSLEPVVFKVSYDAPLEFSYRYTISPFDKRRTILITCSYGFRATLDDEPLTDVLNETRNKQTLVGYLFSSEEPVVLEVITPSQVKPLIHFGIIA